MEKLYFFIGKKNGVTLEIKNILIEKNIPFCDISLDSRGYFADENDVHRVINEGYLPVFIGVTNENQIGIYGEVISSYVSGKYSSALYPVADMLEITLTQRQILIATNDEDKYYDRPYFCNPMLDMLRDGYSRQKIDDVRAFNRKGMGITEEEEMQAEKALHTAMKVSGLIVVMNLPHNKYQAVLDRAFWLQKVQNIVIFTENGEGLYIGFHDVAIRLMNELGGCSSTWNQVEFYHSRQEDFTIICTLLHKESKRKKTEGIL